MMAPRAEHTASHDRVCASDRSAGSRLRPRGCTDASDITLAVSVIATYTSLDARAAWAQGADGSCAAVDSVVTAKLAAPDSGVTVWGRLAAKDSTVNVPAWYLQVVLPEIAHRLDTQGLSYDPLLDVDLRIVITARGGATAIAEPGRGRRIVLTELWTRGGQRHGRNLIAAPTSALARLTDAVGTAQHDGAIPPPPPGLSDSLELTLSLRPDPLGADSSGLRMPLFRTTGLHSDRARDALFDGEVDRRAQVRRGQEPPRWPRALMDHVGAVVLQVAVDRKGRVPKGGVTTLAGEPGFARAALTAVSRWHFYPAMVRGCPEPTVVAIPVMFTNGD